MKPKVMCVDDDQNILSAYKRHLRKQFEIETALGGEAAIEMMMLKGPFAVIISDMKMPNMDGVQFLSRVRASSPNTVRIMLTGNADMQTAIDAVNEGNIFRFLNKPCSPELLVRTIEAGIKQYQLIISEQELLKKTLSGSIKILVEILSIVNPAAFSQASRVRKYVNHITKAMHLPDRWMYEVAATLSQIGCVTLPRQVLTKIYSQVELSNEEKRAIASHPLIGYKLLSNIPRLEIVAGIIKDQQLSFNSKQQAKGSSEEKILLGSQILKVAIEFDRLLYSGKNIREALELMQIRHYEFNPEVLSCIATYQIDKIENRLKMVRVKELIFGMTANQDIHAKNGLLLVAKGQEISYPVIAKLQNHDIQMGIDEPFEVIVPLVK